MMTKQYTCKGRLLLPVFLLAALTAPAYCSDLVDDINVDLSQHSQASVYFQDVNSYLTQYFNPDQAKERNLDFVAQFKPIVRKVLADAIEKIESKKLLVATSGDDKENSPPSAKLPSGLEHFQPLQANQREILPILHDLARSLDSCEQTSLDFLIIILEFNTFQGQILHQFAQTRLGECWRQFIARLVRRVDSSLGKMSAPVFEFFDQLLDQITADQEKLLQENSLRRHKQSKSKGQISIRENNNRELEYDYDGNPVVKPKPFEEVLRARYSLETLERLKLISFDGKPAIRSFALMLNRLFSDHHGGPLKLKQKLPKRQDQLDELAKFLRENLMEPCKQLMQRVRDSCTGAAVFKSHVNQTLGEALVGATQGNLRLDYQLSIYRICRLTVKNSASLLEQLNEMR